MATVATYSTRNLSHEVTVETWFDGRNRARLLVDGVEVDAADVDDIGRAELGVQTPHRVVVGWWWRGRVARCSLILNGENGSALGSVPDLDGSPMGKPRALIPLQPPDGTLARRIYDLQERFPRLSASRHIAFKVGGIVAVILGLPLLLTLIARVNIDLVPDIDWPDWLHYLDPSRYLRPLVEWVPPLLDRLPEWNLPGAGWIKYVIGVLIAIGITRRELRRRAERNEPQQEPDP